MHTHFKPTETFQYWLYQRRSVKTSQNKIFKNNIWRKYHSIQTEITQLNRGYVDNLINKTLSEVNLRERMSALQNKLETRKNILRFVMEYRPSVPNLKQFRWVNTGAIIRGGDRKRGVHPSPWVVPKKSIFRKNCPPPPSRHKPAWIHANLRGASTLYVTRKAAEKKFTKDKKFLTCLSTCP